MKNNAYKALLGNISNVQPFFKGMPMFQKFQPPRIIDARRMRTRYANYNLRRTTNPW